MRPAVVHRQVMDGDHLGGKHRLQGVLRFDSMESGEAGVQHRGLWHSGVGSDVAYLPQQ